MKYLLCLVLFFCIPGAVASTIDWRSDFELAMEEAILERKPLFITFYTKWCGWCKKLNQTTFRDALFAERLGTYYIPVRIDGETRRGLASMFQVKAFPTTILLTRHGGEMGRVVGYQNPQEFSELVMAGLPHRESSYSTLERRVADAPRNPELLYAWGDALFALERYGEARAVFDTILQLPPKDAFEWRAPAQLDRCLSIWKSEGPAAAVSHFEAFFASHPDNERLAYARLQYGLCLQENNQAEEAIKQFRLAGRGNAGDYVRRRSGELARQ